MLLILSQDGGTLVEMTGKILGIYTDNTMVNKRHVAYCNDSVGGKIILGYYESRDRIIDIFTNIMKTYSLSTKNGATFKMPY